MFETQTGAARLQPRNGLKPRQTPDEMLAAVTFQERELVIMTEHAAPALALLGRVVGGDQAVTRRELREARQMVATLARVHRQTDRLRAAVRAIQPAAAD